MKPKEVSYLFTFAGFAWYARESSIVIKTPTGGEIEMPLSTRHNFDISKPLKLILEIPLAREE